MGTKLLRVAVAFLVLTAVSFAAPNFHTVTSNMNYSGPEYVPGQVVVKFKTGIDTKGIKSTAAADHLTIVKTSDLSHYTLVQVPAGKTVADMITTLKADPNVEYAEPNYIYHEFMTPNDTYYSPYQWDMPQMHMPAAWDQSTGNGVVVAVIDVGVAYENYGQYAQAPDLAGTNFVPGYDFVNNDSHPNDDNGHGTHVTGTIAQTTNNNLGCAGVAYNCSIMPIKVLNSQGSGTLTDIADGINWATSHGAQVINMSLGGSSGSSTLQNAVINAYNAGVTIVCAAGNAGSSAPQYPAAYSQCISVSAIRYDKTIASYSSYGSTIDICAPGGDVTVDQNGDGYGDGILQNTFSAPQYTSFGYYFYEGTSMASPHVAGVAALLIAKSGGTLTPQQVRDAIQNTADDLGSTGWDQYYGYGEVNADAALQSISGGGGNPPVANFSGSPTSGTAPLNVSFTDQSTNTPTSWSWTFGDGGTSSAQNPSHTYSSAGTYTVSLTATNAYGSNTSTKTNYITVSNPQQNPPVANFSGSPTSGTAPLAVSFTDQSSNAPTSWSWTFGDGGTSTAQNPSHTYSSAGTYTVSLTATNAYGSDTNTKTNYITVNSPSSNTMHVSDITVWRTTTRNRCRGYATVTIVDGSGAPLSGASVSVTATGPRGGTGTATTGSDGTVTFQTGQTRRNCGTEYCFEVTDVSLSGYTYDQASNAMTKVCESGTVFSAGTAPNNAVQIGQDLPYDFGLDQNYPNPFNPTTQISFEIPAAAHVTLEVFNMAGQKVATLADEYMTAGLHTVTWDATNNSSGVYLYRLQANNQIDSRKMILLK